MEEEEGGSREEVYTEMRKIINSTGKFLLTQFRKVSLFTVFLLCSIRKKFTRGGKKSCFTRDMSFYEMNRLFTEEITYGMLSYKCFKMQLTKSNFNKQRYVF